ncbi:hypothetical protein BGW39_007998 [Mortierella sp. 14UC]|nr:hypothetical protein BGW39_007998 [Mortierella sp. 14UC]
MPRLTHFPLITDCLRLVIDPRLFQHCPNLRIFNASYITVHYRCQDIDPCQPARLNRLVSLGLTGWSALTFNTATLESTENLVSFKIILSCDYDYDEMCFAPPIDELKQSYGIQDSLAHSEDEPVETPATSRPRWTWDWWLPNLTTLTMVGEFAILFEFKMLHGYPALETLILCISTGDEWPTWILSEDDLFFPKGSDSNTDSDDESNDDPSGSTSPSTAEIVVAPAVKELWLQGRWIFGPDMLSSFLNGMFPNLDELKGKDWGGVQAQDFIGMIRTHPSKLNRLLLDVEEPSLEVMKECRIILKDAAGERDVFPVRVWFVEEGRISDEYVVLTP